MPMSTGRRVVSTPPTASSSRCWRHRPPWPWPTRASASLEAEVAERAAEARSAQAQADRRASELSVIHEIQRGAAEALSFQAVVDRVGDRLRELFDTGDIHIVWSDPQGLLQTPYAYQHGERVQIAPIHANFDGLVYKTLSAGRPVVANNAAEMAAFGLKRIAGTDQSLSTAMVPFFAVDRLLGSSSRCRTSSTKAPSARPR